MRARPHGLGAGMVEGLAAECMECLAHGGLTCEWRGEGHRRREGPTGHAEGTDRRERERELQKQRALTRVLDISVCPYILIYHWRALRTTTGCHILSQVGRAAGFGATSVGPNSGCIVQLCAVRQSRHRKSPARCLPNLAISQLRPGLASTCQEIIMFAFVDAGAKKAGFVKHWVDLR